MPTDTYSTAGDFTWTCPAGVTSVDVQCWGGGGGGGKQVSVAVGGGGGAYSAGNESVSAGVGYAVRVGVGGTGSTTATPGAAGDSWFVDATTVMAKGSVGNPGGPATTSVGTTKFKGGNGGNGNGTIGGGGGSSAGTAADGANGATGAAGGAGGTAPSGGGNGGAGANAVNGVDGTAPGGGGGGTRTGTRGGNGAAGMVVLTYTVAAVPVNSVAPAVSGTAQVGQTLTSTTGTWSNSPTGYAYQWKSAGSNVGTDQNTYVPVVGDIGNTITCTVTASNADGPGTPAESAATSAVLPAAPVAAFSGTPLTGPAPLESVFTDASTNTPTSWLWEKNDGSGWTNFAGTPTAQNPTEEFAAGAWSVRLTATNAGGSDPETKTDYVTVTAPSSGSKNMTLLGVG